MSNSKLHVYCAYAGNLRLMLTLKHLLPYFNNLVAAITDQMKVSSDKHMLATLNDQICVCT